MKTLIIETTATAYSDTELVNKIETFLTGTDTEFRTSNGALAYVLFRSIAKRLGVDPSTLIFVYENGEQSTLGKNWNFTHHVDSASKDLINDELFELLS